MAGRPPVALAVMLAAALTAAPLPGPGPGGARAAEAPAGVPDPAAAAPRSPAQVTISVLHTTDLHGHLLAWDYDTGRRAEGFGLAKVATLIRRVRAEPGVRTLLVDAGDCLSGSALEDLHDGRVQAALGRRGTAAARARLAPDPGVLCMNALGYDAMAVGNHEYTYGLGVLERARREARFPWLSANTRRAEGGDTADPPYAPYLVKEIDGVRIGVLGLTTPGVAVYEDAAHYAGLAFDDPVAAARKWVPVLRGRERCDAVIVLAHLGVEEDERGRAFPGQEPGENEALALARDVPGIDALILGHTHVRMASRLEHGVLLTQAGRWGEALGRLDLTFARAEGGSGWRLAERHATLLSVDASVPEDPSIAALARPAHRAAEAFLSRRLAVAARDLDARDARRRDNALVDLVQRAQLDAGRADVSFATPFDPRLSVARGPITVRDAWALYPYANTLAVVEATGQDVKDALEHAASYYSRYDFGRTRQPAVSGRMAASGFDVAQGVRYVLDLTRPEGERVRDLTFRGRPLAPDARLRVAVNDVRLRGGGGYDRWARRRVVWRSDRPIRDLLVDELVKLRRVSGTTDGHWRAEPAWALTGDPAAEPAPAREGLELLVRRGVIPPDSALVWGPDAPLTRRRYGAWLAAVSGSPADAGLVDPTARGGAARPEARGQSPAGPVNADLARVAARYALPEPVKSRFMGAQAGAWDAVGPPLTVGQGAAVLGRVFFPRLAILETTDFHGALLPGAKDRATGRPVGGAGALAGLVERERAKDPLHTIVLDGGDWMQGTPISNLNFGRPVIEFMNREGVDASAVGNHEFDWTADTLFARLGEARYQPLAANWYDRATHARAAGVAPWTILTRDGLAVGVIGLMTTVTPVTTKPQNVARYEFPDGGPVARALEDSLRAAGADVIVIVGHLPATQDSTGAVRGELAEVARAAGGDGGAIAVFGGHSHNRVNGLVDGTPVLIAGALGNTVGRMDFVIDRRTGRPVSEETRRALLTPFGDDSTAVDRRFSAWVDSVNTNLGPLMARVIGKVGADLTRNRLGESAVGDWVADAMRETAHADIAFQNAGGLRADVDAGDITVGDIFEVIPFDNTIVTVTLTGAQVLDVLEQGVSPTNCVQLSGLKLVYDPKRPRGERVVSATLPDGRRLDPAGRYKVALNDFMAQGGDGFTVFARGRDLTDTGILVREAIQAYVERLTAAGRPLTRAAPGRIVNLANPQVAREDAHSVN